MLALVAAQLKFQAGEGAFSHSRPVWVDVRLGTLHALVTKIIGRQLAKTRTDWGRNGLQHRVDASLS